MVWWTVRICLMKQNAHVWTSCIVSVHNLYAMIFWTVQMVQMNKTVVSNFILLHDFIVFTYIRQMWVCNFWDWIEKKIFLILIQMLILYPWIFYDNCLRFSHWHHKKRGWYHICLNKKWVPLPDFRIKVMSNTYII